MQRSYENSPLGMKSSAKIFDVALLKIERRGFGSFVPFRGHIGLQMKLL
jgi:hypothetical protein